LADYRYVAGGVALTAVGVITLLVDSIPVFCWGALIFGPILIIQGMRAPDPNRPVAPMMAPYPGPYGAPPGAYYGQPPPPPPYQQFGAPPPPVDGRPMCPRCSRPTSWNQMAGRWWCMTCQAFA